MLFNRRRAGQRHATLQRLTTTGEKVIDLEAPTSQPAQVPDPSTTAASIAQYSVLFQRYDSNTDLQWRLPATVMTVESFVYLGIVTVDDTATTARWLLAVLGCLLAWVGAASMRRIELTALADRALLDVYEHRLRDQGSTLPALPHTARFNDRLVQLRMLQPTGAPANDRLPAGVFYGSGSARRLNRVIVRLDRLFVFFPPSLTWFILLVFTGAGAAVLAWVL